MKLDSFQKSIPEATYHQLLKQEIAELRPCQTKAIEAGLFDGTNLLVATPTASGKTLVAEMAIHQAIANGGKALYIVPLKALASEKYANFEKQYDFKTGITSGDFDSTDAYLQHYDLIITTSEKFDSLMRHRAEWIKQIQVVVIDEIHLLHDATRGPTLEILITLLRDFLEQPQIIALSATIGNPEELASWLDAELIEDNWRPIELHQGVYLDGEVEFFKKKEKKS